MGKRDRTPLFDPQNTLADYPVDTPARMRRANFRLALFVASSPLRTLAHVVVALLEGLYALAGGVFLIWIAIQKWLQPPAVELPRFLLIVPAFTGVLSSLYSFKVFQNVVRSLRKLSHPKGKE